MRGWFAERGKAGKMPFKSKIVVIHNSKATISSEQWELEVQYLLKLYSWVKSPLSENR